MEKFCAGRGICKITGNTVRIDLQLIGFFRGAFDMFREGWGFDRFEALKPRINFFRGRHFHLCREPQGKCTEKNGSCDKFLFQDHFLSVVLIVLKLLCFLCTIYPSNC